MKSNDSTEIPDSRETPDIPGLPSGTPTQKCLTCTHTQTHTLTFVDCFPMLICVDRCLQFCCSPHWQLAVCLFGCSSCCLMNCDCHWSKSLAWNRQQCLHLALPLGGGRAMRLVCWPPVQNHPCADPWLSTAEVCWRLPGLGPVEAVYVVGVFAVVAVAVVAVRLVS